MKSTSLLTPRFNSVTRSLRRALLAAGLLSTMAGSAFADTTESTWSGGTSTDWSVSGNWGNGIPSASTSAVFNSAFTNQPTLTAASTSQGIWVTGSSTTTGASGLTTIGGSFGLTIAGGATLDSIATGILLDGAGNNSLTINTSSLATSTTTSFLVNNAGTLTVSAPMTIGTGTILTLGSSIAAGTGSIIINGNIGTSNGALTVNSLGGGSVTLAGSNTYTGATKLTAGTLILTNTAALTSSAVTLSGTNLASGGNATLSLLNNSNATFATSGSTVTFAPSGITNGTGNFTINVNRLNSSGTAGSTITFGASGVTQSAGGGNTLVTFTNGNSYNLSMGVVTVSGVSPQYANNMVNGTLTLGGMTYNNATARAFTLTGTSATATTSVGSITDSGTAALSPVMSGLGTLLLTGTNTNLGTYTANSGTIEFAKEVSLFNNTQASWLASKIIINSGATGALQVSTTQTNGDFTSADLAILAPVMWAKTGSTLGLDTVQGDFAYSGNLTQVGALVGGLTKLGVNTLTLSGANTYTGVTTIANGTLSASNIVVSGGNSNLGNATSAVVLGGVSSGVTGLTSGTLNYTGNTATYTRGFNVTAGGGEVDVATAGQTLTIDTGAVTGTGVFTIGGAGNTTITANITTTGATSSLVDNSTGTLTLSGTGNTYAGGTIVNAGTLTVSSTSSLGASTGTLAVNNTNTGAGTNVALNLSASTNTTVGSLSGTVATPSSGTNTDMINIASGTTFTVNQTTAGTYAGVLAGSGSFTLGSSSTSSLTLTGANTYTGATSINAGTLIVGAGGSFAGTAVTVSSGALMKIGGAGSTVAATIGSSGTGSLTLNSGSALSMVNGAINQFAINNTTSGAIALTVNGGTLSFEVGGAGTNNADQILLGSGLMASLSGSTVVNLNIIGTGLNGTQQQLISWSGGTTGSGTFSLGTVTGPTGVYSLTLTMDSTGLYLNEASTSSAFWRGSGTSWTTLSNFSTDLGGATARTLALDNQTIVTFIATGGTNFANTTLDGNTTISGLNFNTSGVGIASGSGGPFTLTIASAGNALTVATGAGAFVNTISSNVAMGANQTWTVTDANSTLAVSGNVSGTGFSLIKAGAGTLILSGTNSYSGTTSINAGNLNVQSNDALDGTSSVTVASGAALQMQGNITTTVATPLTLNGTGTGTAGALENVSGTNTYSGLVTLGSNASIGSDAGALTLSNTGTITGSGFNLTLTGSGNGTVASVIGTGTGSVTKTGSGNWTLNGVNTYTGGTTVGGGTLTLGVTGALGGTNNTLTVNAGTLDLAAHNQTVGNFTGTGGTVVSNGGSSTLTIGSGNGTGGNFAGTLANGTGTLNLTKTGTGTITLSGSNPFTGATSIGAGALNISNANALASTSGITVSSGGALQMTGGISTTTAVGLTLNGAGVTAAPNGALESVAGNNTYSGRITLGSNAAIGSDAGLLTLNNTNAIIGGGNALTLTGAGNGIVSTQIDTSVASVTKSGAGSWTLSGANTYTGATNINGGNLIYNSTGAISSTSQINFGSGTTNSGLVYNGSTVGTISNTLDFTGTSSGIITLGNSGTAAINYTGAINYAGVGNKVTLGNITDTVGGSIGNITDGFNPTSLTKQGQSNSLWVLTTNDGHSGATTVSGGVLQQQLSDYSTLSTLNLGGGAGGVANGNAIFQSSGLLNFLSVGTTLGGGTLNWGNFAGFAAVGGNLTVNTGTNQLVWATNFISSGTNQLSMGSATSNAQVEVQNSFTLGNGGTGGATSRTIFVDKGTGGDSTLLSGIITDALTSTATSTTANTAFNGNEGLIKSGNGTLILTGANDITGNPFAPFAGSVAGNIYGGATLINAGTLVAGANSTTASPISVTVASAALSGQNQITLSSVAGLSVGQVITSNGQLTGANNALGIPEGTYITAITGNTLTLSQNITGVANTGLGGVSGIAAGQVLTVGTPGVFGIANSAITLTAVANSSPTLLIGGAYTISSPVTITAAAPTTGNYGIGGTNTSGTATFSGAITAGQSVVVTEATGGTLAISGNIAGATAATTANFANTGTVNVSGAISGLIGVTQSGTGTTTLSSVSNSYTGATTVNAGVLNVTGSTASGSAVQVNNGGTLAGSGTIGGAVTVANGGAINLQNTAINTLTVGSLTASTGTGVLSIDLGSGTTSDLLAITGAASLGTDVFTINVIGLSGATSGNTYTIVTAASGLSTSNFAVGSVGGSLTGNTFTIGGGGGTITITVGTSSTTSTTYNLATTAGATFLHSGGSTTLNTTITNVGTGSADTLNFTGLGASATGVSGSTTSGGPLAHAGGSSSNTGQTFTSTTLGNNTVNSTVGSATNATLGGSATLGTLTGAAVTVYSGLSTWATNGSGSWGTLATGFGTNWGTNQGSPGLDPSFTNTDTATFGSALTSGTATISLNGASPSLAAITFNNATASYTLAQGSSGTIKLKGAPATITDTNGTHTISAPIELDSNVAISTGHSIDSLTISGVISEAGGAHGITVSGSGATVLSGATANSYTGLTTVSGGELDLNKTAGVVAIKGAGAANVATPDISVTGGLLKFLANDQLGNSVDGTGNVTLSIASGGTIDLHGTTQTLYAYKNAGGVIESLGGRGKLIGTGATATFDGGTNNINFNTTTEDTHIAIGPTTTTSVVVHGSEGNGIGANGVLQLDGGGLGLQFSNGSTLILNSDNQTAGSVELGTTGTTTISVLDATNNSITSGTGGSNPGTINLNTHTAAFNIAPGGSLSVGAVIGDGVGGAGSISKAGNGKLILSTANTYSGGTAVNAGTLLLGNGSGSATGTGPLTVASGATIGGAGSSNSTTFAIGGNVQTGDGVSTTGANSITTITAATGSFTNANLTFNLNSATIGNSSELNVGSTAITFTNTVLTLNLQGSSIVNSSTPYILIAGTGSGSSQYSGLGLSGGVNGIITSGLTYNFSDPTVAAFYANSYLFVNNGDIEIAVVPEPSTWAMMLGGLALLVFWQRRKRNS